MFGAFPPASRRRVVVTGMGIISPLGLDAASTWAALLRGETGTRALQDAPQFLPSVLANDRKRSAEQKTRDLEALLAAMPCKVAASVRQGNFTPTSLESRSFRFLEAAVQEAIVDANLLEPAAAQAAPREKVKPLFQGLTSMDRVGVNLGTGIPSLADVGDVAVNLYGDLAHTPDKVATASSAPSSSAAAAAAAVHYRNVNPLFVPKILGNMPAGLTAIHFGVTGPLGSSVAACATGAHCIGEATEWVRQGRADVMICGATEACLTPIAVAGFSRMRALATLFNDTPETASRPFDLSRSGFVMGEGAGVLVIEELEHALRRGCTTFYGEVRGFGVSSDAHDVAVPHPHGRGAARCVSEALRDGGNVSRHAVQYVNAHATGTIGDTLELDALEQSLIHGHIRGEAAPREETSVPPPSARAGPLCISSSKGALGHLLGAAGSVEAAIALLALRDGRAPATANLHEPCLTAEAQAQRGLHLVQDPHGTALNDCHAVMSTSFGFGGVNTALLFTRV